MKKIIFFLLIVYSAYNSFSQQYQPYPDSETGDIGNFDFRKQLKDLQMPILIIAGRYDRVAVPWMQVKYKDYCPQAQFVMFEHSGHNPQVEEPQKEFKLIDEFLGK